MKRHNLDDMVGSTCFSRKPDLHFQNPFVFMLKEQPSKR